MGNAIRDSPCGQTRETHASQVAALLRCAACCRLCTTKFANLNSAANASPAQNLAKFQETYGSASDLLDLVGLSARTANVTAPLSMGRRLTRHPPVATLYARLSVSERLIPASPATVE